MLQQDWTRFTEEVFLFLSSFCPFIGINMNFSLFLHSAEKHWKILTRLRVFCVHLRTIINCSVGLDQSDGFLLYLKLLSMNFTSSHSECTAQGHTPGHLMPWCIKQAGIVWRCSGSVPHDVDYWNTYIATSNNNKACSVMQSNTTSRPKILLSAVVVTVMIAFVFSELNIRVLGFQKEALLTYFQSSRWFSKHFVSTQDVPDSVSTWIHHMLSTCYWKSFKFWAGEE